MDKSGGNSSRGVCRHDDHARTFGQLDGRVQGTDHAVFHDAGDGPRMRAAAIQIRFHRHRRGSGRQIERRQRRFGGDLLVTHTPFAPIAKNDDL